MGEVAAPPARVATADHALWKQEAQEAAAEVASLEKQLNKEARCGAEPVNSAVLKQSQAPASRQRSSMWFVNRRRKQMERQLAAMQSLQDQLDQKEQEISSLGSELRAAKAMLEDKSVEAEVLRESLRCVP